MNRQRLPYAEGNWFAVPLRNGGYARGVIARADGRGKALGYFFGPRMPEVPRSDGLETLRSRDAVLVALFGDLGFLRGEWPVIGKVTSWQRGEWPLPTFVRVDANAGKAWETTYDEDTLKCIAERVCSPALATVHPYDALYGYGAVEIELTKLCK
jgi:hypothetical protein